ncbi:hypothetical protein SAMN04488005_0906 [Yoonia tamlensis]|uniref:Uncharacterized protein n=1 Tax=Yoonia tamlensis TaxID=390270 RepID=A0A1I6G1H8_9RHOB|nr:hypothetical protein [Yoonia tamlensis]SFR36000.1 hypothetical protein SAMN04488005_0906 [Yoonia tamlensis]
MNYEKRDRKLWHRLEGYSFHERPLSRSLVNQLGDATGYTVDVCYTLVEEYRRFMYLIGSTGEDLTPSPIVDQVWQLHIADHQAYFHDFCPRIIGRTIHRPEDLPPLADDPAYELTLDYYAQEFGRAQVQYWPDPDDGLMRFSRFLIWVVGFAAFALAVIFSSYLFAIFGGLVISISVFLQWKYSSMPVKYQPPKDK